MTALRQALKEDFSYRRLIVVLGIMADKDLRGMLLKLAPMADHIILTQPRYERAAEPESLLELAGGFTDRVELIRSVEIALKRAKEHAGPEDLVLVTGSLYFIGEVKELQERKAVKGPVERGGG
jgi:dihydrofolate synthase/folylpolyglutamate synthase